MVSDGVDFEGGATPPLGVIPAGSREDAELERDSGHSGVSVLIGLVAIGIAALSAVAVWLGS